MVGVDLPEIRPVCERLIDGRGGTCGAPAQWALVMCCPVKFVCGPCLSVVDEKWSTDAAKCRMCGITFTPGRKTFKRVILL